MRLYWANWPTCHSASSHHLWYHISNIMHKSWILWTLILYWNLFLYQTNTAYETTKFAQQSIGTVLYMVGRMSVLALNAGPNIFARLRVWSLYTWIFSHHNYHHNSLLLLLVLFPYKLPSPVCCPTLSTQLTTCVSLTPIPTFSLSPMNNNRCSDGHVTVSVEVLTAATLPDGHTKSHVASNHLQVVEFGFTVGV
jgi:hypothetical protein